MSATNYFEEAILKLLFNGISIDKVAQNNAVNPAVQLYISLHTADPGETGNQTTAECDYVGYARVPVARSGSGWIITGDTAKNTGIVSFPTCTGGNSNITHIGIGLDSTGAGTLLFTGPLDFPLAISNGITPEFRNENMTIKCD